MTSQPDHSLADEPMVDEPLPAESEPIASLTPEPLPGEPLPADHADSLPVQADHISAKNLPLGPMPGELPPRFGDASAFDNSNAPDAVSDVDETDVDGTTGVGSRTPVVSAEPSGLSQQWHDIQSMFVDDPQGSVQQAAQAADQAVAALSETLRQRQTALEPAAGSDGQSNTEQLREALLEYRVFCERVVGLADQLSHAGALT